MRLLLPVAAAASVLATAPAGAVEGMWTPAQLPDIADRLAAAGLALDPGSLTDLTGFPMGAVISLGGCTASFVSPQGLVVTNHHCAAGSVQYNSTADNNLLRNGFLAETRENELPAAPGSRVYVTVDFADVTAAMTAGLDGLSGRARHDALEERRKALIAECEEDPGHRCQVPAFHGGLQYKRIKRLELRDVRLVYAPALAVGKYGGDVDNWLWPRHTGDFAFYRAYVAPDGSPADYAEENVPYAPAHHLKVSAGGLEAGDFVMALGYPGSTYRYRLRSEVEHAFGWLYPTWVALLEDWIATIEKNAPEGTDRRVKYAARLASLNNFLKNLRGQLEGARRVGLSERRGAREAALGDWIAAAPSDRGYAQAIDGLEAAVAESQRARQRSFWYDNVTRPQLLAAAQTLYRLAKEREKADADREPGFQERDVPVIRQRLQRIDRRFDAAVDRAEWMLMLDRYLAQPPSFRVPALDAALGIDGPDVDREVLGRRLEQYYQGTTLDEAALRLALMDAEPAAFEESEDPFVRLAVALHPHEMAEEDAEKEREGRLQALRPRYMEAMIAWQADRGREVYPDANLTLRVTFGSVFGGSPRDGLIYAPFTTLEGIVEKDTGEPPFDAPRAQLALIETGRYGGYALDRLGSVPVNFLTDLDSTGGNSGSATLNARGELVGLLFDGTIESVNSDWNFDPRTTRSIHVDSRYMLWVMELLDGAQHLIDEMSIVR